MKLLTFVISTISFCALGCFPENDLHLKVNKSSETGMSQVEFQGILKDFEGQWSDYVGQKSGKSLIVKGDWHSERVNAHATRDDDNNPVIVINGGIARYKDMDEDSLTLILCHELGHHLGGAPKSLRGRSNKRSWSSAEGQADYFATSFCLERSLKHREWELLKKFEISELTLLDVGCDNMKCLRIIQASYIVSSMFASLKESWAMPSLELSSTNKVSRTNYKHPEPQCRLDTYLAGLRCGLSFPVNFDDVDPFSGVCLDLNSRPECWFSPKVF